MLPTTLTGDALMGDRLAGKVAVVTGGGGGIGAATAELFVNEGALVAIVDPVADAVAGAADRIDPSGAKLLSIIADIGQEAEAERAIKETVSRFGRLDILVTAAGVRLYGPITEATAESWHWILGANLLGAAFCAKFAIPEMAKHGDGRIVNVSSVNAINGRAGMAQYDATKAALLALTRSMACDHAHQGIRVNAVCPGFTITPFHIRRKADADGISYEEAQAVLREEPQNNLLGRGADPMEIARSILFLASDDSSIVTGETLMATGGSGMVATVSFSSGT
jgi:NAD(P)-dependent dehydrogenase (short-subunit alcohol dehydrogenase family)